MKYKFFKDCSDLFIYNFNEVVENNNYMWLVVGYDGYDDIKDFDVEIARELWNGIYNQYCKLSDNTTAILYYQTLTELGYLKVRKHHVNILLDQLSMGKTDEITAMYIDALSRWRFYINKRNPLEMELKKMQRQLRAANNKIGLMEDELKQMREDDAEPMSLVKQAVRIEQTLNRNNIDTRKTTVEKWLAMYDEVKLINEMRSKKKVA